MVEIAEKMCRSLDSIKFYKRNAFDKLDVANITEAISRAELNKLF
jgi:DNA-binding NarL/FixJ family response regulator